MTQWIFTSSLLIAAVLCIRTLAGDRLSARLRYALWGLVLLRLLIPVSIGESALSVQNWLPDAPTETTWTAPPVQQGHPVQRPVNTESRLPEVSEQLPVMNETIETNQPSQPVQDAVANETIQPEIPTEPVNVLPIVWVVGMVIVGAVFLVTNIHFALRLRRSRRYAMTETVPVYVTEAVEVPCLFGVLRPTVYITPDVWEDSLTLRHVIAHELTHYRHRDHLWSLLRCAAVTVHWYNPLVWAAAVLSRKDGELACDEGALGKLGGHERTAYARTLMELTCGSPRGMLMAATSLADSESDLKTRVLRIVKNPKMPKIAIPIVLALLLIIGLMTFTDETNKGLERAWRSENLSEVEDWETVEIMNFHDGVVQQIALYNGRPGAMSTYPYTVEGNKVRVLNNSYDVDGTQGTEYTWDEAAGTLTYYNELYETGYTMTPYDQWEDNDVLPKGNIRFEYAICGDLYANLYKYNPEDVILVAICTSEAKSKAASEPTEGYLYELHCTLDGEPMVIYVAEDWLWMDGKQYTLSKLPLILQELESVAWYSNEPVIDAFGHEYYRYPRNDEAYISMWYGENRYYTFDKAAELLAELEKIRPYTTAENPDVPMEIIDSALAVYVGEDRVHVYSNGVVFDLRTNQWIMPEHTADLCELVADYAWMVENYRIAASFGYGTWKLVEGATDPDAVLTEYHLNIGNGFGIITVHKVGGFYETQFEVEVVGSALRFIFADGTEKLYDYALEGNRLILTCGDETLVLENLLQEQFASYQKVFDIVVRRAPMGSGPLKLTDAQRQQLAQLVNAGLPEAEDGENIIYSDECVYDLCGIHVDGAKRIVTLSDRGKVFFDGKAYVLTNADEVLEYIRELYAAAEGYRLMEIKIGRGANDQIQELTMEVGAREGLYVKQVPENPITASPYAWTMSEEGVVEISTLFETADVLITALRPGTVTLTVSNGSFSDSVVVHVVKEWK